MMIGLLSLWSSVAVVAASDVAPLRIKGLVAAVFSPFDAEGRLNASVVPLQWRYLQATGVSRVFVGGTTGESLSLTTAERKALLETWIAETDATVIAHVGAESLEDARDLAAHAERSGAVAVAAMPPVFFSPADAEALAATIAHVCAAAPTIPCYYYHIPSQTHYDKPMIDFVEAINGTVDNFAGIKFTGLYSGAGFADAQRVLRFDGGRYEVLCGREEMTLEALSVGMTGFVGSQFNVAGDLFNGIVDAFLSGGGDWPALRDAQAVALDLIGAWQVARPGVNGNKYFMDLAGVPVGDARLPSLPVADDAAALRAAFRAFCAKHEAAGLRMCA